MNLAVKGFIKALRSELLIARYTLVPGWLYCCPRYLLACNFLW